MLCYKSLLFSILVAFLLVSFIPSSHAFREETLFPTHQTSRVYGDENGGGGVVLPWGRIERFLADNSGDEQANFTWEFNATRYKGGWNISDNSYWHSAALGALAFWVIAAIWFLAFGLCLICICLCHCCCRQKKPSYGYSRIAYTLSLIFLAFFATAAVVGCIVLYTGQGKFHSSAINTLEYVVHQANTTSENLKNVSGYLSAAKQLNVAQVSLPSNVQADIDQIQGKVNSSANTLTTKTRDNSRNIKNFIESMRSALIVLSVVMLVLTITGFVLSMFGMQFCVYIFVVIGWIFVTNTFVLCGFYLLLHNVTGDTCVAMHQWIQNPSAHTAMDNILPCVENATARETLTRSKEVTSQLVTVMNTVITNISNNNSPPSSAPSYYNQSGPLVPNLCNPFNPDLTDRACAPGEVNLNNATQVWNGYVCQTSANGICVTTGRLTPTMYSQMAAGVNVSSGLVRYSPFLVSLEDCSFVRQTLSNIESTQCPGLRKYSEWIYIGLVMVAVADMLSLVLWVIYGRERRHRANTKELMQRGGPGSQLEKHI